MDNLFSAITALVVGVTSTKAFDYYWRVYKNKSDIAGGEVRAKDQTIAILQERAEDLLKAYQGLELKHEELMKEIVDLKMENATLRAEIKSMGERVSDLEAENIKLKTINEILNHKK
jgi:septal ring factor EnvC (AmiA/AmiB activator)